MELYGPLRLYWEGGYRGEGIIQDIKGIINHGLTSGWQRNTLKKFYNNRALSFLAEECNSKYVDERPHIRTRVRNKTRHAQCLCVARVAIKKPNL